MYLMLHEIVLTVEFNERRERRRCREAIRKCKATIGNSCGEICNNTVTVTVLFQSAIKKLLKRLLEVSVHFLTHEMVVAVWQWCLTFLVNYFTLILFFGVIYAAVWVPYAIIDLCIFGV